MSKSLIAKLSALALVAGAIVGGVSPSNAATLRVPKTAFAACAQVNGTYSVGVDDYTVEAIANSFDITLPQANGITGKIYLIKN